MHEEHDRPIPSARDLRPLYRPPYGLPRRRRAKLFDESEGFGRGYAAPTPPKKSPPRDGGLWTRAVVVAGFPCCAALGIWSSAWGAESASRGSEKRDRASGSALLRHRNQRVPMESRRAIVTPVDKGRKTKAPKASI